MHWLLLYPYTANLICLNLNHPIVASVWLPLSEVVTPLNIRAWGTALHPHPDRAFSCYISARIREGFWDGFCREFPLRSTSRNIPSAGEHPEVISTYLTKECSLGWLLGSFPREDLDILPGLQINRFRVIPKGHNTGKWCLLTDLSYPPGASLNDGISPELCSLVYTSVERVAKVVAEYSWGKLLAKIDIKSAYCLVSVHPQDPPLQAIQWQGAVYIDPMLPLRL